MSNAHTDKTGFAGYLKAHWVALLLTIVVIAIVIQNILVIEAPAKLGLIFTTIELPSWLFLVIAFVAGAITGWFFKRSRKEK